MELSGPNEITVYHPDIFAVTDGPGNSCGKAVWYDFLLPELAVNTTRDKVQHDQRRRIWDKGFTRQGMHSPVCGSGQTLRLRKRSANMKNALDLTQATWKDILPNLPLPDRVSMSPHGSIGLVLMLWEISPSRDLSICFEMNSGITWSSC